MELLQRFADNWKKGGYSNAGKRVLLAVSGGVDSMVMASLFLESEIPFAIGHCNFQLRGEEADKDEQLVAEWCTGHGVPHHHVRFNTAAKMEQWKKGVQETARILRYDWLERTRKDNGYCFIATAHHANDNVETLLMNLLKGTGITGLHGIPPRNGNIIRPLLFAERKHISDYAAIKNVAYRNDASNASAKYLRNDVRLNLVPAIEKIFPNAVSSLNKSIQRFAEAEVLYDKQIATEIKKLLEQRGKDYYIPVRKLQKREPLNTICYELFKPFGFATGQVKDIISLLYAESGHYVVSPTHRVIRNRDFLIVTLFDTRHTDLVMIEEIPYTFTTDGQRYKLQQYDAPVSISQDANTAFINMAKLEQPLLLRRWKQGDYFYPLGMGMKKKKLSRFFVDKKLPLHEKEQVWVLESNKRIVWVAGYRLDERFKIDDKTEQILVVRVEQKK